MNKKAKVIILVLALVISVVLLCGCQEKKSWGIDGDGVYEKKSFGLPSFELPMVIGALLIGFILFNIRRGN